MSWNAIAGEKAGIDAQADSYGITTEKAAYNAAYGLLASYITPLLADLTTTTDITGATFRTRFNDVYTTRQALLNKIAAEAGLRASWAGVSGTGKPADNATRNTGALADKNTAGTADLDAEAATVVLTNEAAAGQDVSAALHQGHCVINVPAQSVACQLLVHASMNLQADGGTLQAVSASVKLRINKTGVAPASGGAALAETAAYRGPKADVGQQAFGSLTLSKAFAYAVGDGARTVAVDVYREGVTPSGNASVTVSNIVMRVEIVKR